MEYAIKIPSLEDTGDQRRFRREIRIQSALNHKNVVPIIEYNDIDMPFYFVMPKASCNLEEYLIKNPEDDNLWIFYQIACGVKYAHKNGIIHRDLKPGNVLIFPNDQDNPIKICDFGLGKFSIRDSTTLTGTYDKMGTPAYMAPEQYNALREVTLSADIFALGKILYRIVTGEIPYPEIDSSIIPGKYRYIIHKACKNNPTERYSSVKEMIKDLDYVTQLQSFSNPSEIILEEIKKILEENIFRSFRTKKLARMFVENSDDNIVLSDILPKLPEPILKSLIENHISLLKPVLKSFNNDISIVGLPFSYCDIIADFYRNIFNLTDDFEIKEMILTKLPHLAYDHNRFYVGGVFGGIVNELEDQSLIMVVKDVLSSDEYVAKWCSDYFDESIPNLIKDVLP